MLCPTENGHLAGTYVIYIRKHTFTDISFIYSSAGAGDRSVQTMYIGIKLTNGRSAAIPKSRLWFDIAQLKLNHI
jgi:hypothetical protein